MGILNLTPDSFSDGGRYQNLDAALDAARHMVEQGADIIDVGGESTRPGAAVVSPEQEARRVLPFVFAARDLGIPISIDTRRALVAEQAIEAGAVIVNDVSAGRDPAMFDVVRNGGAALVLMHMRGVPKTMQGNTQYEDLISEVVDHLGARAEAAVSAGIRKDRIVLDPGVGFGKSAHGNLELMCSLPSLVELGYPVLVGASRKSWLGKLFGQAPGQRMAGSVAAALYALRRGARILRVHDLGSTRRAVDVYWRLMSMESKS